MILASFCFSVLRLP